MKKNLFAAIAMLGIGISACAQLKGIVTEEVDNGGKVPGRTYRIYAEVTNKNDQVYIVFGDSAHTLEIKSTKPFYQCKMGGAMAKDVNRKAMQLNDSLQFDSWITIGARDNYDNNTMTLGLDLSGFEAGNSILYKKDGAWFCVPTDKQAYAKEDKRILLMQLTTKGLVTGNLNVMGKSAAGEQYISNDLKFTCGERGKK